MHRVMVLKRRRGNATNQYRPQPRGSHLVPFLADKLGIANVLSDRRNGDVLPTDPSRKAIRREGLGKGNNEQQRDTGSTRDCQSQRGCVGSALDVPPSIHTSPD